MNATAKTTKQRLETEGLRSTTHKLTIFLDYPHDNVVEINAYFTLTWSGTPGAPGELYNIAVSGLPQSAHSLKAMLREYCAELSERLKTQEIDLKYVVERWLVQRFQPAGYCPQLEGRHATSVLDAAAKLFMACYNIAPFT